MFIEVGDAVLRKYKIFLVLTLQRDNEPISIFMDIILVNFKKIYNLYRSLSVDP